MEPVLAGRWDKAKRPLSRALASTEQNHCTAYRLNHDEIFSRIKAAKEMPRVLASLFSRVISDSGNVKVTRRELSSG